MWNNMIPGGITFTSIKIFTAAIQEMCGTVVGVVDMIVAWEAQIAWVLGAVPSELLLYFWHTAFAGRVACWRSVYWFA